MDRALVAALEPIMVKAVLFDLDNCIAPADEVGEELFAPAFDAIRQANRSVLSEHALEAAFADCWRHPLDWVAQRHGFSDAMVAAAMRAFQSLEVGGPMRGYGDLDALAALPLQRFLVTSGFRRLQQSKLRALGIDAWFTEIVIDEVDGPPPRGKEPIFRDILAGWRLPPEEVLVVGDNPESELAAGNRLGMTTVQTLRPGVPSSEVADLHVHDFH
ncbi:MAG: HAD family hydrolase, partial [Halofilum sp. (in: g-proteobacteria)]